MVNKENKQEGTIEPLVELTCAPDRRCCINSATCSATFQVISGNLVWYRCGCM
jgi:hypothetical protein